MDRRLATALARAAVLAMIGSLLSGCIGETMVDGVGPLAVVVRKFPTADHQAPSVHPNSQPAKDGQG